MVNAEEYLANVPGTAEYIQAQKTKRVTYTIQKMSFKEIQAQAKQQAPEGMELTYLVEEKEGEWKAWYKPKDKTQKLDWSKSWGTSVYMEGPEAGFSIMTFGLSDIATAPTVQQVYEQAQKDVSGRAIPIKTEDVLAASVFVASLAAPIIQRHFWRTPQQAYYNAMKRMSKELYHPTALEQAGIKRSVSSEMWLNVQQPTETFRFQPAEQFYRVTRGTPTTPFSKTLEAAIYGKAKGGLSADYLLVPRSTWSMPSLLKELSMTPKLYPTSHAFPLLLPSFMLGQGQRQAQMLQLSQVQVQTQVQKQAQQLRQRTQQALAMTTPNISRTVTRQVPRFPNLRLRQPNYSKLEKDLFGQWFRKTHKIRTPQQAAELFGLTKRRRKGRLPRMPNL